MSRLTTQHQRLYLLPPGSGPDPDTPGSGASGADVQGRTRALVLALNGPADWSLLGVVWRGVQADLDLPAPGIAVSGEDALQLWFSLVEPVDEAPGQVFLRGLQQHYLPDVQSTRLRLLAVDGAATAVRIPPVSMRPDRWSAFVAPDLAAVFAEEPWLDFQPGAEAQAELLSRLTSISPAAFRAALTWLDAAADDPTRTAAGAGDTSPPSAPAGHPRVDHGEPYRDPRQFLQDVMNDRSVPLALRIQAATALLPSERAGN